jgi:hypothetical protein
MTFNINDVKPTNRSKEYPDYGYLETGSYVARVVQVIGIGVHERPPYKGQQKPPAPFLRVTFELPYETIDRQLDDGTTEKQPRWLSKEFVFSGAELSTCAKWLNKLDPNNELKGDWSATLGREVQLYVTATQGKKDPTKYYNDVKDIMAVPKGMVVPEIFNEEKLMIFSPRDGSPESVAKFDSMPKWLQDKITNALDFQGSPLSLALSGKPDVNSPPTSPEPEVEVTPSSTDDDPWG